MENKNEKYIALLMNNALFRNFDEGKITDTLGRLNAGIKEFKKGEFVYYEGQQNVKAAIVLEGSLHIIKEDFWGNRSILAEVTKGDIFAETYSCIGSEALSVSVEAKERSECLFLDIKRMTEGGEEVANPRFLANLISILAQKNLFLTRKIDHISQRTTRQKLISYLSEVRRQQGMDKFEIPFNRQQLADYLAVDRSAMSSELSKLQREGIIEYHKNRFFLKSPIK